MHNKNSQIIVTEFKKRKERNRQKLKSVYLGLIDLDSITVTDGEIGGEDTDERYYNDFLLW